MSYIRSGSNPESLYIWCDATHVTIMAGGDYVISAPDKDWVAFLKKAGQNPDKYIWADSPVTFRGFTVEESWSKPYPEMPKGVKPGDPEWEKYWEDSKDCNPQVKLSYGKKSVMMWLTTWYYIVMSNYDRRWKKECKCKTKR